MKTPKDITGEYYKCPEDLFYAVDTPCEYTVMSALFMFSNGMNRGIVTASTTTLGQGLVGNRQVKRILKKFEDDEHKFLTKTEVEPYKPKQIRLDIDRILWYARKRMDIQTLSRKAIREYKESQKDAMAVQRVNFKPELKERIREDD